MKLATWNVNSVRVREARLTAFLAREQPDVLCLQELKVRDDDFPHDVVRASGYEAVTFGQKTYNGVGILAKAGIAIENVSRSFQDGDDDPQARVIAADVNGVRVVSIYVPNGGEVGSEKWTYKQDWLRRLRAYAFSRLHLSAKVAICGDLNIAPEARDVARPDRWKNSVLFHPDMTTSFKDLLSLGLVDTTRLHHQGEGPFTWWDYRMLAFPKGDGLRIDHILASTSMALTCTQVRVDRDERKGTQPSDHAPVMAVFS
ncbi:MAG: exodeoxyribonuclease III [Vicinamibacteria bacterium]|nr:exodeoxyribonuclease III [Vicinamibacteria bacterium]